MKFTAVALSSFIGLTLFLGACETPETTTPDAPEVVPGEESGEVVPPVDETVPETEPEVVPEPEAE